MSSMKSSTPDENENQLSLQPIDPAAEQSLDALLFEMLRGDRPEDSRLQAKKIADRVEFDNVDSNADHGFFTLEELQMAAQAAQRDLKRFERVPSFVVAPPIQVSADSPLTHVRSAAVSSGPRNSPSAVTPSAVASEGRGDLGRWVFLAVAASFVGTLLGISWWQRSEERKVANESVNESVSGQPTANPEPIPTETIVVNGPVLDGGSVAAIPGNDRGVAGKSVDPSNVAGGASNRPLGQNDARDRMQIPDAKLDSDGSEGVVVARDLNRERKTEVESKEGASSTEIASKAAGAKPFTLGATEDTETIGVIDDQFQHLWKRLDIETKVLTEREQLEDRIGRIVIGRTPTSAERESVRKSAKSTRDAIEQLANKWIASEEFDQHWADVLAGYYVGVSGKSTADSGRQAFVSWLQQAIHRNEPIGGIERSMVTADPEEISTHPEAYWVKHWLESWKGSEQLILDSGSHKAVGLNRNQLGSLETLAMQSFKMAGKSTAACSHCHTEDSKSLSDRAEWSKNLSRFEGGRESGLFAGLAAVWSTVAGAAKPDFFLADAEDRLAIVAPLFPDGKRVFSKQDRRVALGEWFEGAVSARQSLVDLVWTQSFGQPLVPPLGLTDEEGADERRDLLQFLGSKLQRDSVGLRRLVYWIAMSAPASVTEASFGGADYLMLDAATLVKQRRNSQLFATYSGDLKRAAATNELATLVKYFGPNYATAIDRTALAQPSVVYQPSATGKQSPTTDELDRWPAQRVAYELENEIPYAKADALAKQLAESGLPWEQIVDHAFMIVQSRWPRADERKQSQDLLEWSDGDRSKATLRLVNAINPY